MSKFRLILLGNYYATSAAHLLRLGRSVKRDYFDGKISYKRAWKEIDKYLRLASQRIKLTERLSAIAKGDTSLNNAVLKLRHEYVELYSWVNR